MSKIKEILEGWGNMLFQGYDGLAPELQQRVDERLSKCDDCKIRTGVICDPTKVGTHEQTGKIVRGCGCHLRAKAMSVNSQCPLGKW
jgi:hypothetical protein